MLKWQNSKIFLQSQLKSIFRNCKVVNIGCLVKVFPSLINVSNWKSCLRPQINGESISNPYRSSICPYLNILWRSTFSPVIIEAILNFLSQDLTTDLARGVCSPFMLIIRWGSSSRSYLNDNCQFSLKLHYW